MPIADVFVTERDYTLYTLAAQQFIPICGDPPPLCNIEFDVLPTTTDVTLRGESDGTITINWTGNDGATECYINGALDDTVPSGTTTYTFTGLTAGYYNILIQDELECYATSNSIQIFDGEFRTGDFVVNEPVTLSAAENPIILNLKTARNTGTPLASEGNIYVSGTITDGDYLKFTLTYPQAYEATFYAKEFPNRNSYFLASTLKNSIGGTVGNNSTTEIATSIAEALSNDSVISRLYWIRSNNQYVYLIAKENTASLDLSTVISSTGNLTITQTQNGNADYDGAISEDYSLYADIFVNSTVQYGENPDINTFNKVAQLELPFNANNNLHYFDLSDVLKNTVSTPKIDFTLTGYTTISSMLSGYRIIYGEKYPLIPNSSTKKSRVKGSVNTKYLLNAALPWEDANDLSGYTGTYLHNVKTDFDATFSFDYPTTSNTYVDIDDYLIDTGSTETTNIAFKIYDGLNDNTYDWQTGTTFTLTGGTYGSTQGQMYISGETNGVKFTYQRNYSTTASFEVGSFSLNNSTAMIDGVKFLTNAPNPKFVQRDSSEFLYILLPKDFGRTLKIKGDLYFYDGTTLTGETLYTVSTGTTNWGGVFMFAAGYNELGLADYETYSGGTRKIRKVDFALYQSDDINGDFLLSEQKSYRYEIDEASRRYGVAFLNKLGTYDIFDFSGEIISSITHTNESYEVPRGIGLQGNSPYGFQATTVYDTKVVKKIVANTGWINSDTFDWLMELLESNRCYNYTETDQSFLIAGTPIYSKSTNDDLFQIDVTFTETLYQNSVSV